MPASNTNPVATSSVFTQCVPDDAHRPAVVPRDGLTRLAKVGDSFGAKGVSFVAGVARKPDTGAVPVPVPKEPGLIRRMINRLIAPGLTLMLAARMRRYGVGFFESFKAARALRAVMERKGVKSDPATLVTAFPESLKAMLADTHVTAFFARLEASFAQGVPVDMWMMATKHFRSERKALATLAVLFQDTGAFGAHAQQILSDPKLKVLHPQAMRLAALCAHAAKPSIARTLLPTQLRTAPEVRPYHFLVMAEIAARLREAGLSQKAAAAAPYSLNAAYEFYQTRYATETQPDGVTALMLEPGRAIREVVFPRDPKTYDTQDVGGLSDIYLGYAGAAYGAGVKDIDAFDTFRPVFSASPKKFARTAFV